MSSGPPLRWGLIGASYFADTVVGPAIRAAGDAVAIVYSHDAERARRLADRLQAQSATDRLEELWAAGLDAVYISSTNEAHAEQAVAAARAGCHVLCEKPLATSVEEAEAMQAACDRHGVVLATNHHLRNAPGPRTVRRLIAAGEVGEVRSVWLMQAGLLPEEWHGWRLRSRERGGGIALDATVHDVDLLRFVLGAEVESVVGLAANQGLASDGVEDAVVTVLRFAGGVLAVCHDAWNVPSAEPRMVIHGSHGSIEVADPMAPDESQVIHLVRDGERRLVDLGASRGAYLETVEAFGAAVRGRGAPSCTGRDGIASLSAALAARGPA